MEPIGTVDREIWMSGKVVIGVDEVGLGPLAGPLTAAAVLMACDPEIEGIDDSKKLTEKKRDTLAQLITELCVWSIKDRSHEEIDEHGLSEMRFDAMRDAVKTVAAKYLKQSPGGAKDLVVLVDGNQEIKKLGLTQRAIVGGDGLSVAIGAASIIAKVHRDRIMVEWAKKYPLYGFELHKGYGTQAHLQAIEEHGLCPLHRRSVRTSRKKERNDAWEDAQKRKASWHELQRLGGYRK